MFSVTKLIRQYCTVEKFDVINLLGMVTRDKFIFKFIRSSGPGGQNVNKLNTKVELRLNLSNADWLPKHVRTKLLVQEKNLINKDSELIVTSEKTRTQHRNVDDALQKVREMITKATFIPEPPSEETLKRLKERKEKANEKRLVDKKYRSSKKTDRKNID